MEHTKGKWTQGKSNTLIYAGDKCVADCLIRPRHEESEANARRICLCCNSHDELVEALKYALDRLGGWREIVAELDEMPKDEAIDKAMWAVLDQMDIWKIEAKQTLANAATTSH